MCERIFTVVCPFLLLIFFARCDTEKPGAEAISVENTSDLEWVAIFDLPSSLALSPDGKCLAVGGVAGNIVVFDLRAGRGLPSRALPGATATPEWSALE